jgi:hypothetical protein
MYSVAMTTISDLDKAVAYLEVNQERNDFLRSLFSQWRNKGALSAKQIEAVLRNISKDKDSAKASVDPVTEQGLYRSGTVVYRAKWNKEHTALYAMRFVPDAPSKSERFVYERGAIQSLSAKDRLTVEQAEELGALHGVCCVCGAELTDPESVKRGIGPVCRGKV